jgi:hypothetical protein
MGGWLKNCRGSGREPSWHNWDITPVISWRLWWNPRETCQDALCPGRDANRALPEHKSQPEIEFRSSSLEPVTLLTEVSRFTICMPACRSMDISTEKGNRPITVAARSNIGIVGSNPTQYMDVCVYSVCVVLCRYRPWDGLISLPRSPTLGLWDSNFIIN